MDGFFQVIELISVAGFLIVIPVCFLKGRAVFGWFGVLMFLSGTALSFPVYRLYNDARVNDWWWWLWQIQGVAIVSILVWVAVKPARSESWWMQRTTRRASEHST